MDAQPHPPGDLVVDADAHTGYFTLLASQLVGPTDRVIAIEPSPAFYRALTANIEANGCTNVRTVNAAVSDAAGRMTFYLERSTNLGDTTSVLPRTVVSSFEADAARRSAGRAPRRGPGVGREVARRTG
ncbi:FkbM family methyltransferase [Streptomyces sp. NPDC088812]|uniref:FkbM family methyltransferase n=1 Tax=Streptomyces sp. NPDC088812 TaxID=3365905 RepID=UPI0037FAC51A